MKNLLITLLFLISSQIHHTQTFEVESLKVSGDNDKRINLVILSEGYQVSEFAKFKNDAINFMTDMFSQSPFVEYTNYFNVYIIKVPSNESGSDHPGTATDVIEPASAIINVDTYFNTSYDSFNFHRLLFSSDYATINTVLANNFPEFDQTIILVNSDEYGGSGGQFPFTSTGTSANEIAIHELGHSLFDLKDEYYPGDVLAAEAINMTQETNPALVKWKNWLGINSVGIYAYASSGAAATWNRPHQNCKMRYLGVPFCSVCKEGMIEKIHDLVSPIDSYMPISNTVNNPSFPIDFNLNLIKPEPNTLENEWVLNSLNIANNVEVVSLLEINLIEGINTLNSIVTDNTSFLKIDNHETIHLSMVTWTINYSSLGIEEIDSVLNNLSITVYPNPTNDVINFKFENNNNLSLKIDIVSIDGKKIETLFVDNSQTLQIDISAYSTGLYLANFYSNNILLSNKRIIKN